MSRRRKASSSGSIDGDQTSIYEGRRKKPTKRGHEGGAGEVPQAIRVISMKTPAAPPHVAQVNPQPLPPQPRQVKLRAISEVSGPTIPLGNLAPPRDSKEVVKRRVRDYMIVGLAVVIVGCLVTLGMWWVARS